MTKAFSNTQIDRLGDRLRKGSRVESDLQLLDDYRQSFSESYESVLQTIQKRSQIQTGRIAKSTPSIVEKLQRESIRLSQMQDIAGCRVVVENIMEQDQLVAALKADFLHVSIMDRRNDPSNGYRAVHIIAEISGKPIEIQVRSSLQHLWAELSEKSSDVLDPTIKYGGGSESWRKFLSASSESVASYEAFETTHHKTEILQNTALAAHEIFEKSFANFLAHHLPAQSQELREMREKLEESVRTNVRLEKNVEKQRIILRDLRNFNVKLLSGMILSLDKLREQKP